MAVEVFVRLPVKEDWRSLLALHQRSQALHYPWVFPPLDETGCKQYLLRCQTDTFEGLMICHAVSQKIVGVANLSQIFYGGFQNAYLGYYVDTEWAGKGVMTAGVGLAIAHAFDTLGLHRLEANIQPENTASLCLVSRLGFSKEGVSEHYLRVNGAWRDHERWALTVENRLSPTPSP